MTPTLIPLGSARHETRACDHGETMELTPVYFYCQPGAARDVMPLGAVSAVTRAATVGDEVELNPIYEWTPPGVRQD